MEYQLLRDICTTYWNIRQDMPQDPARSYVHDLVMQCFRTMGIDYEDREDAAHIAHEIAFGIPKRAYVGNLVRTNE